MRVVAQLWLRPGHSSCGSNVSAFFWTCGTTCQPSAPRRSASRFRLLPARTAGIVGRVAPAVCGGRAVEPADSKLLRSDLQWAATEVAGTVVAEREYQAMSWPHPRRLVLIRHRVRDEDEGRVGKRLLDVPGWRFQALVTNLPGTSHPPLRVWRYYNGRADCENVIKELREGFALPTLCWKNSGPARLR